MAGFQRVCVEVYTLPFLETTPLTVVVTAGERRGPVARRPTHAHFPAAWSRRLTMNPNVADLFNG